ncbi:uncharacterized protein [Miscanthus floridulus]|uniref:uncharacterized protein n=1 Tax=Miscanthus floridulus TaxID=154761 RepID=UPI003459EE7B
MERRAEKSLLVLSCLLVFPLVSSVPMPRSLGLGSQQQHPLALKLTSSQEMTIGEAMNLGRPEARMDMEVNDYPTPGANDDHDPGHGRT